MHWPLPSSMLPLLFEEIFVGDKAAIYRENDSFIKN
jgi:hypothetical protein